jgi:hypothetical protein
MVIVAPLDRSLEIADLVREAVGGDRGGSGDEGIAVQTEMEAQDGALEVVEDVGDRGFVGDLEGEADFGDAEEMEGFPGGDAAAEE